jgi:hypothetical protein
MAPFQRQIVSGNAIASVVNRRDFLTSPSLAYGRIPKLAKATYVRNCQICQVPGPSTRNGLTFSTDPRVPRRGHRHILTERVQMEIIQMAYA